MVLNTKEKHIRNGNKVFALKGKMRNLQVQRLILHSGEIKSETIPYILYLERKLKKTGKKIKPETFKSVRTVQDVVDAVAQLLHEE